MRLIRLFYRPNNDEITTDTIADFYQMSESKKIKQEVKAQLKKHFGRKWANKVSDQCEHVPDTIRRYFSSDTSNEHIMRISLELVKKAREDEAETLKSLRA